MRIDAQSLHRALRMVKPAIGKNKYLPIISNVLLDGDDVVGTNLDYTVRYHMNPTDSEGSHFLMPFDRLLGMSKKYGGEFGFEIGDDHITIDHGGGQTEVPLPGDTEDFPNVDSASGTETTTVSTKQLIADLDRALLSKDKDIVLDGKKGELVTTDDSRLRTIRVDWLSGVGESQFAVNPDTVKRTLQTLRKIVKKVPEVEIGFPGPMVIKNETVELQLRVSRELPRWFSRVENIKKHLTLCEPCYFDAEDLYTALRRIKVMLPKKGGQQFNIYLNALGATFVLDNPDLGKAQIDVVGTIPDSMHGQARHGFVRPFMEALGTTNGAIELLLPESGPMTINGTLVSPSKDANPVWKEFPLPQVEAKPVKVSRVTKAPKEPKPKKETAPKTPRTPRTNKAKASTKAEVVLVNPAGETRDGYRWITTYQRKDGTQVKGYWRIHKA
jgi:hypothetical protein